MSDQNAFDYKRIGRHLLFWLAYVLYNVLSEGWQENDSWVFSLSPNIYTATVVIIVVVYVNLGVLMPALYAKRKYILYSIGILLLLFMGGLANRFFSWYFWLPLERMADPASTEPKAFWIWARIIKDAADVFPVMVATMALKLMLQSFKNEQQLRQTEKEKHKAEMSLLQAQINPHFFFNTLNSLYSLTLSGSKKASDVVVRLSDLMRYMLYEASADKVLLKDEIIYLENYIAIEHMRFSERLELSFQCSGNMEGMMIVPLLLLPFIENAFKHGIGDNSGWITIDLKVVERQLFLKVESSFKHSQKNVPGGFGLNNVKKRLELTYPQRYQLNIKQDSETYSVDLKISL